MSQRPWQGYKIASKNPIKIWFDYELIWLKTQGDSIAKAYHQPYELKLTFKLPHDILLFFLFRETNKPDLKGL